MPDYLYHPTRRTAAYAWTATGTPLDAAVVADPLALPVLPAIAPGPPRAAVSSYRALVSPTPLDTGIVDTYIPSPELPDSARGAIRAAVQAYIARVSPTTREPVANWPAFDTFTDVAGTALTLHAPDSGGMWVSHPLAKGQFVISNANRLFYNSATLSIQAIVYHSAIPASADYDVACDIRCVADPATTEAIGIMGRIDPTVISGYQARYRNLTGFQLFKYLNSTPTQLGVTYARTLSSGESPRLALRMAGNAITLLVDGVIRIGPITDSAVTGPGYAGVFGTATNADTNTAGNHLDNFNVQWSDPPIAALMPVRAFGPKPVSYAMFVGAPLDVAAPVNPNIFPILPDSARGPARTSAAAYSLITSAVPLDAGAQPPTLYLPRTAAGPRLAANAAYLAELDTTPLDAGMAVAAPILPPSLPHRVPLQFNQAPYRLIVSAPQDAGVAQPIIPAVLPAFARGPRWAAQSSYVALVSPPPLTPGDLQIFPDVFGSTIAIATDPFASTTVNSTADPFSSTV